MKRNTKQMTIMILAMSISSSLIAGEIDTSGQEPYEQCGYCHEYDGNSRMPSFPRLAGQKSAYIIKQLRDFRSGKRLGKMQATAELLSDKDIKIVAKYFSKQVVISNVDKKLSTSQKQLAEQLFFRGDKARGLKSCVSCHGVNALGSGNIPRLAGQHATYLNQQLKLFKSGKRKNDVFGHMQTIGGLLHSHEIKALVAYLSSLKVSDQSALQNKKMALKTNRYE